MATSVYLSLWYSLLMKNIPRNSKHASQLFGDDFIALMTKHMKDSEKAELTEEMMQAALDGNKELAAIFSRMIKAELDNIKSSAS